MLFIMIALSVTFLEIGPTLAMVPNGEIGYAGIFPKVGLCPNKPQKLLGILMDPPPSVPIETGPNPAATAAHEPPELPPAFNDKFHGFLVSPYLRL